MSALQKTFRNMTGVALIGASVVITRAADGSTPPVYTLTDDGPGELLESNAVELDDNGSISVWVPDGLYRLQVMIGSTEVVAFSSVQVGAGAVPTHNSYFDRDEAAAAAARGDIPAEATTIYTLSRTQAFDEGAARYSRMSASDFAALGLLTATVPIVSFVDYSGDRWVLDEPDPNLAMAGCFGQELGLQPIITAPYDCTPFILALADYGVKRWKAVVIQYGNRNYYLHTMCDLPDRAGITGQQTQGNATLAQPDIEAVGGTNWMPGLVINPAVSLRVGDNSYGKFVCVKRAGIVIHTTAEGALDAQQAFAGTGITKTPGGASRNVKIDNLVCYGFAFGMDAYKMHGLRLGDVYGDCNTLLMVRSSGETVKVGGYKRKPLMTNNAATDARSVQVLALYDAGGNVGLVMSEDVSALLLTTGQRVGSQKLPDAFVSQRRTVTVQDPTHVILQDEPWDPAYAAFSLTEKSTITWQPFLGGGVVEFYNASGNVGVRTAVEMPFKVGHLALLVCAELAPRGMRSVLTKVSTTDFVLDVPWDAGLTSLPLKSCELAGMPNNRTHNTVVSYWGDKRGWACAAIDSDGIRIDGATKGGSGLYLDSGSAHITWANEGGSTGETDQNDPTTIGMYVSQPRTRATADLKSTGEAYWVNMENHGDTTHLYASQLTDNGTCSLHLTRGRIVAWGLTTKGPGRVIFDDPTTVAMSSLDVLHGEISPDKLTGIATNFPRVSLRWRSPGNVKVLNQIAHTWAWWAWNDDGTYAQVATLDASGWTTKPKKPRTVSSGALTLTDAYHQAPIILDGTGNGIALDAATVSDGFTCRITNLRGSDWAWPAFTNGTVQILGVYPIAPTKVRNNGEMTLSVYDTGTGRKVFLRGDLTP